MTVTPTYLRENLYKILDQVLETKKPIEIIRKGQTLKITVEKKKSEQNWQTLMYILMLFVLILTVLFN